MSESTVSSSENTVPTNAALAAARIAVASQRAFQETIEQKVEERRHSDERSDRAPAEKSGRDDAAAVVLGGSLGGTESSAAVSDEEATPAVGSRGGTVNITV